MFGSTRSAFSLLSLIALATVSAVVGLLLTSGASVSRAEPAGLAAVNNQLWHQDIPGVEGAIEGGEAFGGALAIGDFDSDGFNDMAVGIPDEDVSGHANAGAVDIFYGTEDGLTADDDQFITQNSFTPGSSAAFDNFGEALGTGDFDDDGYTDLVIGVPGDVVSEFDNAGLAYVMYGSATGLTFAGYQTLHQDNGLEGLASAGDDFGSAFASGDFNGDGRDDLAIGVPDEEIIFGADEVGGVNVLYGSPDGLLLDGNQLWTQASPNVEGAPEDGDKFGASLATGDFDHDGKDDLAIGSPGESVDDIDAAGATNILYGGPTGLTAAEDQVIHQAITGVPEAPEEDDAFGAALAAGDFDNDDYEDLAIGIPGESSGGQEAAGAFLVVRGSDEGLILDESVNYIKSTAGVAGQLNVSPQDRFGAALAAADFNGDDYVDLVVGAPGHDTDAFNGAGAVHVFVGSASGPSGQGREFFRAGRDGILGEPTNGADFGAALAVGDINGGGLPDLAVGAPSAIVDDIIDAGTVNVIYSGIVFATPTNTPAPPTNTPTNTPTSTPVSPTNTPTNTPPPGATDTPTSPATDTPTNTPTNTPTPVPTALIGDVDCIGYVNAVDAFLVLQYVAGLLSALPCLDNADANQNGIVDTVDAALILQYSAGLLPSLPL